MPVAELQTPDARRPTPAPKVRRGRAAQAPNGTSGWRRLVYLLVRCDRRNVALSNSNDRSGLFTRRIPGRTDLLLLAQPPGALGDFVSPLCLEIRAGPPGWPAWSAPAGTARCSRRFLNVLASSRCAVHRAGAAPQALLELTTWAERGYDLAITPDGPRGPRYVVQDGVMSLAQVTGLPIVPVSYHLQLENPVEKLGPVSNSAAVFALRNHRRPNHCACRAKPRTPNARNCANSSKPSCAPSRGIENHHRITHMIARVSLEIALRKEFDYLDSAGTGRASRSRQPRAGAVRPAQNFRLRHRAGRGIRARESQADPQGHRRANAGHAEGSETGALDWRILLLRAGNRA